MFDLFTPKSRKHTTRPCQEPAIVECCRGRPAGSTAGFTAGFTVGSTNRISSSTQQELSVFERNSGCTTCGWARAGAGAGASAGTGAGAGAIAGMPIEAIYRH